MHFLIRRWNLDSIMILGLVWVVSVSGALAQGAASLTGYVLDSTDKAVANATVDVINERTGGTLTLKTTDAGVYQSPFIEPGSYSLKVNAPGFKESLTKGVVVELGEPRGFDVHLSVGATQSVVEVTAAAPLLNTENPGLGQNIDSTVVPKLPYFSRSAGALLGLSPGVRYTGEDSISYGASRYNVAGWTNVNVMVDQSPVMGDREDVAQMTLNPSVEALSEVRVIESQYSAEFGADIGALVLMQTKSGGNNWHGGVYEYLRNTVFDTGNHFSHTKPVDQQNMFGGTLGGPILRRKKLFFFTAQEGEILTEPIGAVLTVPTAAMKAGNFSGLNPIYDPATTVCTAAGCTRSPFANNQIPASEIDAVATNLLKYFPSPNQPGNVNNLTASTGYTVNLYRGVGKVDWDISAKDTLTGVWLLSYNKQINKGVPAYNAISPATSPTLGGFGFRYQSQVYNFSETHLFSSTTFVTNRVIWRPRYITRINPAVDPAAMYAQNLGIKNYAGEVMPPSLGGDLGFPYFSFNGYTGLGPSSGLLFQENPISEFDYLGSVSLIRANHSIKAGVQVERGRHAAPDQTWPTGTFGFAAPESSNPGVAGTGDAFASFLLGQVDSATTELGPPLNWRNVYLAPWVSDDWKVDPRLTLNLGLRWDIDFPVTEIQNRGNSFNLTAINPVSGTPGIYEFLGINGWPTNFFNTDFHRFAPRIGLSYQLTDRTVFRGGFGIYNIAPILGANRRAPSAGYTTVATFNSTNGGILPAFPLAQGFPAYPVGGDPSLLNPSFGAVPVGSTPNSSPTYVDRNWRFGYGENFDASVQESLSSSMVIEIAGQGALGRKLPYDQQLNEVPPQYWGLNGANFSRRPFPQFNDVDNIKTAEGNVTYLGGFVRFDKRFSSGINLIANFNIGKPIGFVGGSLYYPQLSRTQTVYDTANGATGVPLKQGVFAWTYALPFGIGRKYFSHGIAANLLGGWDWNGILTAHSGVPFDVSSGTDSLNANSPLSNRVNLVGRPIPQNRNPSNYLDASSFAAPALGTVGTYWGAKYYSPDNVLINTTLSKVFVLREGMNLKVLAESFNLFNSPQWGIPDTTLTDPGFGVITGAGSNAGANVSNSFDGARIMQIAARIDF
jgi:hypothetical protein